MSETVKCCREWAVYADNAGTTILVHADNEAGEERVRLLRGDHYHCSKCGARFTLTETGEVQVSPSVEKLLAALALELSDHCDCPMDYSDWQCPATPETHDYESGPVECWLIYYGLAATYADAQALWKRMGEAAKSDGNN